MALGFCKKISRASKSNMYEIADEFLADSGKGHAVAAEGCEFDNDSDVEKAEHSSPSKPGTKVPQTRNKSSARPGTKVPKNIPKEQTKEHTPPKSPQGGTGERRNLDCSDDAQNYTATSRDIGLHGSAFEQFYKAFPRKLNYEKAKSAFMWAMNTHGVSPEHLIEAAGIYADKRKSEKTDPRYIKTASNWLAAQCWKDIPSSGRPPMSEFDRAIQNSF